ncbi:Gfo/Idh/MocA family protein [Stakelama pacifica]|uniref:Galactose 1-dehydrogenase n=1 Tax=Stakelama pacifica TaxID=517720 RepID=A0A4R6FLA0_9SPHN|nr:Gfo/Idh/MocA family oxidoreductase [Stakelama pacifica]TDN82309.1 galactose 1-dehydrogenase [Stakelama pacifica]GGO95677.1 D-galactose 1-dehydrogenase [Stakelama pacifica]
MSVTKIALVGIGKIARDQHVPTIAASDRFELVAAVTGHQPPEGIPGYRTIAEMVQAHPEVQAVSICTPPRGRMQVIAEALSHNLDVMIEKPPAATISEAETFAGMARDAGRVFYATWHSREAAAVEPAKQWLDGKTIRRVEVNWKEDVRVWHPGQAWIWEPGIGVFDPGINALSVLTHILPLPMMLQSAELRFPSNRDAPIAADLDYTHGDAPVRVEFDFDQRGPQTWDIVIETDAGHLKLSEGASKMAVDGEAVAVDDDPEYARLYRHFAKLLDARQSDADLSPFRHVADAYLLGRRREVGPFEE